MEVIKSFTGLWHTVFDEDTISIKETISIIHCDELYIVMKIRDVLNAYYTMPIVTDYTKSYTEALDWYEKWNRKLMWNMTT